MEFTGERYVTDLNSAQISYEHWHRYLYSTQFVKGKDVLDIASGEGYGSRLLAQTAKSVMGVDISDEAIAFANERYRQNNLSFLQGSVENIPLAGTNKIDVVVSFETIEHVNVEAQELFLQEVKRLLRDDGIFIVSSPNKLLYSDIPKYKNEFHLKEFYEQEFFEFLRKFFRHVILFGQKIFAGSDMWRLGDGEHGSAFTEYHISNEGNKFLVSDDKKESLYLIAVCSDSEIKAAKNSFLVDKSLSILSERDGQIASLNQAVADRDLAINSLTSDLKRIKSSPSWKLTMPLRFADSLLRGDWTAIRKHFVFRWSQASRSWAAINAPSHALPDFLTNRDVSLVAELAADAYVPLLQVHPPKNVPVRLIAFYLPQFHAIAENDAFWGKGFTEWTNVKTAQPQFEGHYQPHVPGELGYYNLLEPDIQHRQIELAKLYGVGGFCFYTYWFGGKLLLENPVENYLNDHSLDLPFCLCWANENWTRRWDGRDKDILICQRHSTEDDLAFIQHISKYMRDKRYIRIDGKPLLLLYRPNLLPSAKKTAKLWRTWCMQNGIGEIYLAYTQSFETVDPNKYGFDAAIEFPPNNFAPANITATVKPLTDRFNCTAYDWRFFVERSRNYQKPAYKLFRCVCPSWDNTARRKSKGTIFLNSTPQAYQEWLTNAITETSTRISNPDERLIFVNAWNEWAESAHLEPDERYGYAWLDATRRALCEQAPTYIIK